MNSDDVIQKLRQNFPFEPTADQLYAIYVLGKFLISKVESPLLIIKGYAGTGKTSLLITVVKTLKEMDTDCVLLAPTGRASKVMANYSKRYAQTIHKKIYTITKVGDDMEGFSLTKNKHKNTLFIVDEASMINGETQYYTGSSLLDDVIKYVYNNKGCRLLFMGDTAQLPPVGSTLSPALNLAFIKQNYSVAGAAIEMKEVVRQELDSGILKFATQLREVLNQDGTDLQFDLANQTDVVSITGTELEEELDTAYSTFGWEETIVICRSNKLANQFNQHIRTRIKWQENELSVGDYLMVVKNNYFWLPPDSKAGFIANGDTIEVLNVGSIEDKYGFRFVSATVRLVDYPDEPEHDVKLLLDTIMAESPALTQAQNKKLFNAVRDDYASIKNKTERLLKIKSDPYFNALQVKFGYAVTCHKSQGGQWQAVFVEQGYIQNNELDHEYIRWLYTAFSRASKKLYLVNFHPKFFIE